MERITMQACSLIVLCLINISIGCKPKIDKNGNLVPYENNGQNHIETSNTEANYHGGNGGNLVNTENNVITNYPYRGDVGGSPNYYGDIILPEGQIHFQPYNQGSEYNIHNLPSSGHYTREGDNGRLLKFKKSTAYRTDGYSASKLYNVGRSGPTHNYQDLHKSGFSNGASVNDRFPNYKNNKFNGEATGLAAPWYYDENGKFIPVSLRNI